MPPRIDTTSIGCVAILVVYVALSLILYRTTQWRAWLVLASPGALMLLGGVINRLRSLSLLIEWRRVLAPRGVRCLVVYSESPTWQRHIEEVWLPRVGDQAVTLNWSARATWTHSLEVRVFKRFVDGRRNYNPAVLVFRGLRQPGVYRFYYAFQEAKHGRTEYTESLEAELFQELGV